MLNPGKPAAAGAWRVFSQRRGIFICLMFVVIFFFVKTNLNGVVLDWSWTPFKPPPFRTHKNHPLSNTTQSTSSGGGGGGGGGAPGPTPAASTSAGLTARTSSPHTPSTITPQEVNTTTPIRTTNVTPQVTSKQTQRPVAVPYVSPGPYMVEYPYKYNFIINEPQKCEQEKPFVVLMVPVAPHNREHRDVIRSTWGGESSVQDKVVKLFFLLGVLSGDGSEQLAEQLQQESGEHHDLIQSDFLDCYKNLTIKTMVMMEWLDAHCSSATYAIKVDSDMFLNVNNLIGMLLGAPKTNYMTGLVAQGAQVLRDQKSKWYLPWEVFPESNYPPYALGLGYIVSLDLPKKLVEASRHVKALYIEDVYLGLCMRHLGIRPTNPPNGGYFHVIPMQYNRCAFSQIVATTTEHMDRVAAWKDFKRPGPYC